MSEKIKARHLERDAYVYVRQSTLTQVKENRESQLRQRQLAPRVEELGWPHERVHVVDEDLGVSGTSTNNRDGFERIRRAVCEGRAGLVAFTEGSRMARNNADWYRLVELCAHADVLLLDDRGVYDPSHREDRVLLGVQGALAEYEMLLFRHRAQESLAQMAERGELYQDIPVGFIVTPANTLEKHPDRRVQRALKTFFEKFAELSSARELSQWIEDNQFQMPMLRDRKRPELVDWETPNYSRILRLLGHPAYAGAYPYGRSRTVTEIDEHGEVKKRRVRNLPLSEWKVLIRDHHPGYISWEEYERNRAKVLANANMGGRMTTRAPQNGQALLTGIVRCRRCGRKLVVRYSRGRGRYCCQPPPGGRHQSGCMTFGAASVDERVAVDVLAAVAPAGIEAALRAQELLAGERERQREALTLELEQTQYEAERAFRQYTRVEPENRLVAAELERRWNEKLNAVARVRSRLEHFDATCVPPSEVDFDELGKLGANVPRVWHHPEADAKLKKRIIRTVIEEVVADVDEDNDTVVLLVHWAGGHHTELSVPRRRTRSRLPCPDLVHVVRVLRTVAPDAEIARILNRSTVLTSQGNTWTPKRVGTFRRTHDIPCFSAREKTEQGLLLQCEAANKVGISSMSIHRLIKRGILAAEQPLEGLPCIIREAELARPEVQMAIEAVKEGQRVPLTGSPNQKRLF